MQGKQEALRGIKWETKQFAVPPQNENKTIKGSAASVYNWPD